MKFLTPDYFLNQDTLWLAKDLLGKLLVTKMDGKITSGRIVETEAYLGVNDRASHAFGGRRTKRTETMYLPGGHCYVYLCYGIHHLFNIVTNQKDIPHAILIRGLEPVEGIETMMKRRSKILPDQTLTRGPGSLSQALGITTAHSGIPLNACICIAENKKSFSLELLGESPRVGVDYAGEDALLPYRFFEKNNPNVTKPNR